MMAAPHSVSTFEQTPARPRRWLIYGSILEAHVCESLEAALRRRGQELIRVSRLEGTIRATCSPEELAAVDRRVMAAVEQNPVDVVFNFRPAELGPETLRKLRAAGVTTIVWFPDDPLLYETNTRSIADEYDITLHTGDERILDLYESNSRADHDVRRYSFPFWSDRTFYPHVYDPDSAEFDLGYLGNCNSPRKMGRYALMASLPFSTVVYGALGPGGDYASIHGGLIQDWSTIPEHLAKLKIAVNTPQRFTGIEHDPLYWPGVERFGEFQFPSRIAQYAACGVPIISKSALATPVPSVLTVASRADLIDCAADLLSDTEKLLAQSRLVSADFDAYLSADSRAELLLQLLDRPDAAESIEARANRWRLGGETPAVPVTDTMLPPVEVQREQLAEKSFEPAAHYRILHIGRDAFGPTDIVARIRNSLTASGHAVFSFDPSEHPAAVHNPQGLDAGFGPIEISYDYLQAVRESFAPDVILFTAGGYCFSKEDFERAHADGYVVVGLHLSDPDVFPTAVTYSDRFHYFTTNALAALAMYREAGFSNAIYMPFGIDRDYVTAEVDANGAYDADIICLGHGRSDRLPVMTELARVFPEDVRVYGKAWGDLGGKVVTGADAIAASRGGRFHVNFPGTFAGYSNVKVGVFETAASGGILLTEKLPELEQFFRFDREILGYDNIAELRALLEYYRANPEEAEEIRRSALQRVTTDHLWEHRLESLFETIREDLASRTMLAQDRYTGLSLRPMPGRARKVVCYGFLGAKNAGDDLLLKVTAQRLREAVPESYVEAIGYDVQHTVAQLGHYGVRLDDRSGIRTMLADATCLAYLGGLLHDGGYARTSGLPEVFLDPKQGVSAHAATSLTAKMLGVPTVLHGTGGGPLRNADARRVVRLIVDDARLTTTRDPETLELLQELGGQSEEILLAGDLVFGLNTDDVDPEPGRAWCADQGLPDAKVKLLVNLREWMRSDATTADSSIPTMSPVFEAILARALDRFVEEHDAYVVFAPMSWSGWGHDNRANEKVLAAMKHADRARIYDLQGDYGEMLSIFSACDFAIAMRLHASILMHRLGKPCIGIAYNETISSHYAQMNCADLLLPLRFTDAEATAMIERLVSDRAGITTTVKAAVEAGQAASDKAFSLVNDLVAGHRFVPTGRPSYYPRSTSVEAVELARARATIEGLRDEAQAQRAKLKALRAKKDRAIAERNRAIRQRAKARAEVRALRASTSFRIGAGAVRLLRSPWRIVYLPRWTVQAIAAARRR